MIKQMSTDEYKEFIRKLLTQHNRGLVTDRELSQQIAVLTLEFQKYSPDYQIP